MSKRPTRATRSRPRPIRRTSSRPPIVRVPATRALQEEEQRWDAFEATLASEVARRKSSERGLPPYDKPRSYLKREVYRYVLERLADDRGRELQQPPSSDFSFKYQ